MPAGPVNPIDLAIPKIGGGVIDLNTDAFNVVLCTDAQALAENFAGGSGTAQYSDLTGEVSDVATGYDTGGQPLANVTWLGSGATTSFAADANTWPALTASVKYAVVVKSDGASPPTLSDIVAICDVETSDPTGRTSAGGDFTINWATALFQFVRTT